MKKWDYCRELFILDETISEATSIASTEIDYSIYLNKMGKDGWELISVVEEKDDDGTVLLFIILYFKREVI